MDLVRNVQLLEATMQQIIDHPENHYQGWWYQETDCGTVACFAGWACLLAGVTVKHVQEGIQPPKARAMVGGVALPVANVARDLLGLNWEESIVLFDGGNSRGMLELMVKDLVNGDELSAPTRYREQVYRGRPQYAPW